tara:strand:- start:591 stop:863 length:273 start_codon:yes stop_codon:yes gene_type:complete
MKKIIFALTITYSLNSFSGDGGVIGGGNPRVQLGLKSIIQSPNVELVNQIDNIEIFDEVKFPETFKEKIDLLKKTEVQSIQLIDGQVISY